MLHVHTPFAIVGSRLRWVIAHNAIAPDPRADIFDRARSCQPMLLARIEPQAHLGWNLVFFMSR
jgi:hypothetical protein